MSRKYSTREEPEIKEPMAIVRLSTDAGDLIVWTLWPVADHTANLIADMSLVSSLRDVRRLLIVCLEDLEAHVIRGYALEVMCENPDLLNPKKDDADFPF